MNKGIFYKIVSLKILKYLQMDQILINLKSLLIKIYLFNVENK